VARAAGVSLKTVSRVVNDVPTVHPDLTERVLAAATQLGFRRNHIARTLRAGRSTATIGLLIEDLANPFYSAIAAEVSATARGDAYDKSLVRYGAHDPDLAAAAASELLDTADPPTAFFCANNRVTVGALGEIWRRRVDVAIAGFDDLELADLMPRPLTLVSYDTRSLARTAADALFRRIAGDTSPPATFPIPTRLSTRGPQPARP